MTTLVSRSGAEDLRSSKEASELNLEDNFDSLLLDDEDVDEDNAEEEEEEVLKGFKADELEVIEGSLVLLLLLLLPEFDVRDGLLEDNILPLLELLLIS